MNRQGPPDHLENEATTDSKPVPTPATIPAPPREPESEVYVCAPPASQNEEPVPFSDAITVARPPV